MVRVALHSLQSVLISLTSNVYFSLLFLPTVDILSRFYEKHGAFNDENKMSLHYIILFVCMH